MAKGIYKYDWSVVQRYYDEGHGYLHCREKFGFAKDTWIKAIRCGRIKTRPRKWSLEKIMAKSRSRYTIKRRLLAAGILRNVCEQCEISEWRGRPLTIQVDHRNGVKDDHRLENLRMLCPNCHSQTETYAARNRRSRGWKNAKRAGANPAFSAIVIPSTAPNKLRRDRGRASRHDVCPRFVKGPAPSRSPRRLRLAQLRGARDHTKHTAHSRSHGNFAL